MEAVAAEGGAPTKAQILAAAHSNPMTGEWQHLNKYLEGIASRSSDEHIPLLPRAVAAGVVSAQASNNAAALYSSSATHHSSGAAAAGHTQQGLIGGHGQYRQNVGYGLPGLLDIHSGTSDSTNPAAQEGVNIVQTMSAPVGQAGAPANMLCGSTSVPFRLDPAVAAIPPLPAQYRQDPAYMFQSEFMMQPPSFGNPPSLGTGSHHGSMGGQFRQNTATTTALGSGTSTTYLPDSIGSGPFVLPHML